MTAISSVDMIHLPACSMSVWKRGYEVTVLPSPTLCDIKALGPAHIAPTSAPLSYCALRISPHKKFYKQKEREKEKKKRRERNTINISEYITISRPDIVPMLDTSTRTAVNTQMRCRWTFSYIKSTTADINRKYRLYIHYL